MQTCRKLVFGRCVEALGINEKVAARVEVETAGGRDGKQSGVDDMSSSDGVDSQ